MHLHYQRQGQGPALIILHGLFGSSDNWGTPARLLSQDFDVINVDLRNHGQSFHHQQHDYPSMADDVLALMDSLEIESCVLLGHSMGGKVAMQLALNHPKRINKLIVVDIAPVAYPRHHDDIFTALNQLDLANLQSRSQADQLLTPLVPETGVRQFLLKNLSKQPQGGFQWRCNLSVLQQQYEQISRPPSGSSFTGSTLFIKGELSHYIKSEYREAVLALFPQAQLKLIAGAGHWPHAEKPELFMRTLQRFLLH